MRKNTLPVLAYLVVIGTGMIKFMAEAEPTLAGIAWAGVKTLMLAFAMTLIAGILVLVKDFYVYGKSTLQE